MRAEVPTPDNIMDDPPRNKDTASGEVPNTTFVLDDPPLNTGDATDANVSTPIYGNPNSNDEDDLFDEIMHEDDNTTVGVIPVPTTFKLLQKLFSSKTLFDFGPSSSLDEIEGQENQEGINITSPHP